MVKPLSDLVEVITGASGGIGRATALQFAELGANLVLAARSRENLAQAAKECDGNQSMISPQLGQFWASENPGISSSRIGD
jgi:short-subunit dehydrogenase